MRSGRERVLWTNDRMDASRIHNEQISGPNPDVKYPCEFRNAVELAIYIQMADILLILFYPKPIFWSFLQFHRRPKTHRVSVKAGYGKTAADQ